MGVHVGVGEQPELFELGGVEKVGFVDDDHDPSSAFVFFGGDRVGGLWDERGLVEPGDAAEGGDDRGVETTGADGGVPEVDDRVPGAVQVGGGGPDGDGLAGADFAGDDAEGGFVDTPGDAGDRFVVTGVVVQHARREVPAEGHAGEAVVCLETFDGHDWSSGPVVGIWSWPGIWSASVASARPL